MEAIIVALITQAGVLGAVVAQGRRSRKAVGDLTDKVQTNHGKEPFEYLEMVAEVREAVNQSRDDVKQLVMLLARHTEQDAENFQAIDRKLEALRRA